jgi:hypothetical protein
MADDVLIPEDRRAPDGMIWCCAACGKQAEDRFGIIGERTRGWDASCMMQAVAVPKQNATTASHSGEEASDATTQA